MLRDHQPEAVDVDLLRWPDLVCARPVRRLTKAVWRVQPQANVGFRNRSERLRDGKLIREGIQDERARGKHLDGLIAGARVLKNFTDRRSEARTGHPVVVREGRAGGGPDERCATEPQQVSTIETETILVAHERFSFAENFRLQKSTKARCARWGLYAQRASENCSRRDG